MVKVANKGAHGESVMDLGDCVSGGPEVVTSLEWTGVPTQMVMKHYPSQFKTDAVALYRSRPGATIRSVADDLGVNPETLRNWIRLDDGRRRGPVAASSGPGSPAPSGSLEVENAELRSRVRELEDERETLRRAAKYFAGQTRWPTASSSSMTTGGAWASIGCVR